MLETFLQAIILLSSVAVIPALVSTEARVRRIGLTIGLIGQPAWLLSSFLHAQWGIALVAMWWTMFYAWGLWTHRRKPGNGRSPAYATRSR